MFASSFAAASHRLRGGASPFMLRANFSLFTTTSDSPPSKTIKFCPECKINAAEGVCKSCLENKKSLTPAKITKMLSEYVVGQDQVKRALGVSMFLHLQRVKANDWIKYDGKGKPKAEQQKQSVVAAATESEDKFANVFVGGFVVQINGQMMLKQGNGKRKSWKVLTDLQANWDRVSGLLAVAKSDKPSVMAELAIHASKAPTEEERIQLIDECRDKLNRDGGDLTARSTLLDILDEEIGHNDWTPVSALVISQRLEVIRALESIGGAEDLVFRCRVMWLARPVIKCMEALNAYKEIVLGGKAGTYLPLDEQKIVIQERDKLTSHSFHRGILPAKFQLCLDCEKVLNVCTSKDEDVVIAIDAVSRCLESSLFVEASSAASKPAATTPHQVLEEEEASAPTAEPTSSDDKPQQEQLDEAAASATYSGRIQDLKKLQVAKFEKSNVLLMGPTGSGKTLLAKSLANCVQVPLVICDATSLTAAGYVGDDVDTILYKLLEEANWDVTRAESGIVFLDEIDKIAKRSGSGRTKDISGESVQFGLLKILEGSKVQITKKQKSGNGSSGGAFGGQGERTSTVTIDTSNILFVCSGAFTGMDSIVARRTQSRSLGFSNMVQKSYDSDTAGLAQRDQLFAQVEPADLVEFGMIPEFVGRFSTITATKFLTEEDLVRVLTEPTNSVVNQMRALFRLSFASPVELVFTPEALHAVAKRAIKLTSGARGLKVIIEQLCRTSLFSLGEQPNVTHVIVDEQAVESNGKTCLHLTADEYSAWEQQRSSTSETKTVAESSG